MSYSEDIFKNYFGKDDNPDYLKVHKANQESYEDNFSDLLPRDSQAHILEIGCGAGQLLYYLKAKGYANIEGVDIGNDQIEMVKKMGIQAVAIASIAEYLKSRSSSYDLIIMNQVIEHLPKAGLLDDLRVIRGALKDGGTFLFATPNMACLSGQFQRNIDFTHETGFTERNAYQVMRVAGFNDIKVRGDRISLKPRVKRIAWWALNRLWFATLGFIYYIERGSDRPKVLSKELIVTGKK
jgi:2-polyprenyl-3-methyl-5-hydroxy-6-metoxy-1,4-benzoquinol methylase